MRKSSRNTKRLNYEVFNRTGEKVPYDDSSKDSSPEHSDTDTVKDDVMADDDNKPKTLMLEESIISDKLDDFLAVNDIQILSSTDSIKESLKELDELTDNYRMKHKLLSIELQHQYQETYSTIFSDKIKSIQHYKRLLKIKQNDISIVNQDTHDRKVNFIINEINHNITSLKSELTLDDDETDDEIFRRKQELNQINKQFKLISSMLMELHGEVLNENAQGLVNQHNKRYEVLLELKAVYVKKINEEMKTREVDKKKIFNNSILNIKLSKFKGYESDCDIYTFKSQFEKLYLKSTPVDVLPDLLKNNYLDNPAAQLVKNVNNIDEIWRRLTDAYGDQKTMLTKKLNHLNSLDAPWKQKNPEKVVENLVKIINTMKDLLHLAKTHQIEEKLFHGDGLQRIYKLLGDKRIMRWLAISCEHTKEGEEQWHQLIEFLEKDVKVHQQKALLHIKPSDDKPRSTVTTRSHFTQEYDEPPTKMQSACFICGDTDHVMTNGPNGMKLTQYFSCLKFVEMSPLQRFSTLRSKGLCFQCLFPGAELKGKHKEGRCQRDFTCKHSSHDRYPIKKHVLVCDEHKTTPENQDLLQHYKSRCILRHRQIELPSYTKEINLTYHNKPSSYSVEASKTNDDSVNDAAIYMLQTIEIEEKTYSIFYDSGCGDFISRYDAVKEIGSRAAQICPGPIKIGGVGGITTEAQHGVYSVRIPLKNGEDAVMSGICMNNITATFPTYPLKEVGRDIRNAYKGNRNTLPSLPSTVGGRTDFMIGIKYLKYFPEMIFQLPSGLSIYKSHFKNIDGSDGVIGGPHRIFTDIEKNHHLSKGFIQNQFSLYKTGYQVDVDVSLLGFKENLCDVNFKDDIETKHLDESLTYAVKKIKLFNEVENAGSEIKYRCVKCRSCQDCKNHDVNEALSIKEEIEQDLINRSVNVDVNRCITTAVLPLLHDPSTRLHPNRNKALKVYHQQLKKLKSNEADKLAILRSEEKLQTLGHVAYVKNLPAETQQHLKENLVQNFIPWRVAWKENSTTTPCRIVFDASQSTASGYSLNDIIAKGRNNMNKLVEIFVRWRTHPIAFHTDIQKMYNTVQLSESDWCLQRYLWQKDLDDTQQPEEKVIRTLIYGVKSSGNQAERGLRETAKIFKNDYPQVYETVLNDVYVDDCMSGGATINEVKQRSDELEVVINKGGFKLKGVTISGCDPIDSLSNDGEAICVAGLHWYPKIDELKLDIKDINFAKKSRGRKPEMIPNVPVNLTRRHCTSKIAEVFDISGLMTPITATLKLDLHNLVTRKLDWDDKIPDDLRKLWCSNFDKISDLRNIRYKRAVVPEDAENLDITTLDFGDASKWLICAAIYVRFKRRCGLFSCQLIFSRSRLVPDGMSQPRAELYAALINTHAGEVVRKALQKFHKYSIKFTDSQIVFYWLMNENRTLKQWVRNRVIEIKRLTEDARWRYVRSEDMIADLGTRPCYDVNEINNDSLWMKGYEWMTKEESVFPMKSIEEIKLNNVDVKDIQVESNEVTVKETNDLINTNHHLTSTNQKIPDDVSAYYKFSKYIVDPNRHRWKSVIRILAIVMLFIKKLRVKTSKQTKNEKKDEKGTQNKQLKHQVILSEDDIQQAVRYFNKKGTSEVMKFVKPTKYQHLTKEVDGVLLYTGRILENDQATIVGQATSVMTDLSSTTFCVPVFSNKSPIAYSMVIDIHWNNENVQHRGIETTLREVLKTVYIIEGRSLVKMVKAKCERCRYLEKHTIDVIMGPISNHNLTIAPAFYSTQVDLAGPFLSFSAQHKRTTIKIWLSVFCCATTSAVKIKVMDDYSTSSFLQAFTRFSCDVGYPKILLPDAGSQLIKGCDSMRLSFADIQYRLHKDVAVDFNVCPVGAHNMHGKVERKIQEIKSSLERTLKTNRLSVLQWETITSSIANSINNLPLALHNVKSDFEVMDLITPNRLLMGRNNDRSPVDSLQVTTNLEKLIIQNNKIYKAWFDCWLTTHVPKLMERPKWFNTDDDVQIGDVVLFLKQDGVILSNYQYGMVENVMPSRDGKIRKVKIKFKNHSENTSRFTIRSTRDIVVIHKIDELSLHEQLYDAARSCVY